MTKEQIEHYKKGGVFTATFNPESKDLSSRSLMSLGKTIRVWPNIIGCPVVQVSEFEGDFPFNSRSVDGWIPERDLQDLTIIDEFSGFAYGDGHHLYKLHYLTQDKIDANFGKTSLTPPIVIGREYDSDMDEYVINRLSDPKADKVERAIWSGEQYSELKWITIYEEATVAG